MVRAMDAKDLREKAATCLQLAQGLSWNNPGRSKLMEMAQTFKDALRNLKRKRNSNDSN
jgi:hypothetical protein